MGEGVRDGCADMNYPGTVSEKMNNRARFAIAVLGNKCYNTLQNKEGKGEG